MNILDTERLLLQKATLKDAPFILELVNSPNWLAYIGDRGIQTLADAKKYIQNSLIDFCQQNGFGLYIVALKTNGAPIGICGFLKRTYLDHPDLGFATLPKYEGQGYTFEAAKVTMEYGTQHLNLTTILAITTAANTKSKNLLAKLGFVLKSNILDEAKKELLVYTNRP